MIQDIKDTKSDAIRTGIKYFDPMEMAVVLLMLINNRLNVLELKAITPDKPAQTQAIKELEATRLAKDHLMQLVKTLTPFYKPSELTVLGFSADTPTMDESADVQPIV